MVRIPTAYYTADPETIFAWATTGNDLFNREQDLYRLALALERHDHGENRGLPVTRFAATSVNEGMYGIQSIPEWAYQSGSVSTRALAPGAVTDDKLANDKVNVGGDTMTGDLRTQRGANGPTGYVFFGNAENYIGTNGQHFSYVNPAGLGGHYFTGTGGIIAVNGGIVAAGDGRIYRPGNPVTGFIYFNQTGGTPAAFGYNGSYFEAGGQQIVRWPDLEASMNSVVNFPLGGIAAFQSLGDINALPARFSRFTPAEGRLLIGGGTTGGVGFNDGSYYGTPSGAAPSWIIPGASAPTITYTQPTATHDLRTPETPVSATSSFLAPTTGGTTATAPAGHNHPGNQVITGTITLTGGGVSVSGGGGSGQWLPPMYCVHWARRNT